MGREGWVHRILPRVPGCLVEREERGGGVCEGRRV